jgi:hypothetical protein
VCVSTYGTMPALAPEPIRETYRLRGRETEKQEKESGRASWKHVSRHGWPSGRPAPVEEVPGFDGAKKKKKVRVSGRAAHLLSKNGGNKEEGTGLESDLRKGGGRGEESR